MKILIKKTISKYNNLSYDLDASVKKGIIVIIYIKKNEITNDFHFNINANDEK